MLDYLDFVATPDSTYSLRPLWFWNARLDEDDVRQQLGQMNAKGVRGGKGGVISMTRGLARTYGPFGITVNTIAPGQARTHLLLDDIEEQTLQQMTEATPLGRIAEPAEIVSVAVFLASQHASFVSGATLSVSGGFLMY